MALTSALHRRRTSKKNRTIPTIPVESFGGGLVDVSAVDTESRACSTPRCLGGGPASPCYVCPFQAPVLGPGGHGSTPLPAHSCPESVYSARVGKYWPKGVRTARRPQATHPTPVSYFMTSETPRSRETTQYLPPSNARPQGDRASRSLALVQRGQIWSVCRSRYVRCPAASERRSSSSHCRGRVGR